MREQCRGRVSAVWRRRSLAGCLLLLGLAGSLLHGCRDDLVSDLDANQPPDTYLTGAPAESATTFYQVHFYWYGNDVDGRVTGYEFAITDSLPADEDTLTYHFTTRTDSVFRFNVGAGQQVLGHRFYIRAIDNDGATDETPAWRFFGAIDLHPPQPEFTLAEAYDPTDPTGQRRMALTSTHPQVPEDTVPAGWNVRFRWRGSDMDRMINEFGDTVIVGEVRQYEYGLSPFDVGSRLGGVGDTSVAYSGLTSALYTFSLRAVDDAGFRGLDAKQRTFVWNLDPDTYFTASDSLDPLTGDSLLAILATSAAWEGERRFFAGDTVPLTANASGSVQPVTITVGVWGRDPDDILNMGVDRFQRKLGDDRYLPVENQLVVLDRRYTLASELSVRCADGYGRPDFTPATMMIYVNKAPRLLREFTDGQGNLLLQQPQPDAIIDASADTLILRPNGRLRVRVKAWDPDSTARRFTYLFEVPPYFGLEVGCENTDQPCTYEVSVPPSLLEGLTSTPREASVTVRVIEHASGDPVPLQVDRSIRFYIVK